MKSYMIRARRIEIVLYWCVLAAAAWLVVLTFYALASAIRMGEADLRRGSTPISFAPASAARATPAR